MTDDDDIDPEHPVTVERDMLVLTIGVLAGSGAWRNPEVSTLIRYLARRARFIRPFGMEST